MPYDKSRKSCSRTDLVHCMKVSRYRACVRPARVPIERFWTACFRPIDGDKRSFCHRRVADVGILLWPFALSVPKSVLPAADEKGLGIVTTASSADHPSRRDFLFVATGAAAAVGGVATLWPFVSQMNPDGSTIAAGAPTQVRLAPIAEGHDLKG